jgi:hypothetical protein
MNVVQCFGEIPKKNQKSTICAELINLPLMCGSAAFHCSERRRASQTAMLEKCDARCSPGGWCAVKPGFQFQDLATLGAIWTSWSFAAPLMALSMH